MKGFFKNLEKRAFFFISELINVFIFINRGEVGRVKEAADYTDQKYFFQTRYFEADCIFGPSTYFANSSRFEKGCKFGPNCVFGDNLLFLGECHFEKGSSFGKYNSFLGDAFFETPQYCKRNCHALRKVYFDNEYHTKFLGSINIINAIKLEDFTFKL